MQQDITRGRNMTDSLYQAGQGQGGTHNAILSSEDYLSQARRDLGNIEDGFYIAPAFLDKLSIHVAKNFLDLPKIKVPLILGKLPTELELNMKNWQQHQLSLQSAQTASEQMQSQCPTCLLSWLLTSAQRSKEQHIHSSGLLLLVQVSGEARARERPSR